MTGADCIKMRKIAKEFRRMAGLYSIRQNGALINYASSMWNIADGIDLMLKGYTVEVKANERTRTI